MRLKTVFLVSTLLSFFIGCSTYTISTNELIDQFRENQKSKEVPTNIPSAGLIWAFLSSKYKSNQIEKFSCYTSSGKKVYLYIDKNVQLEITKKSDEDVVSMYFDTVFLVEDKLVGLRSRLLDLTKEVNINDIGKIEITAEFPKSEEIK